MTPRIPDNPICFDVPAIKEDRLDRQDNTTDETAPKVASDVVTDKPIGRVSRNVTSRHGERARNH